MLLTLSTKAQDAAYNQLRENNVGSSRGAAVALDPRTGAVQAMVSFPSFDPNPLADHNTEAAQAEYDKLDGARNSPLRNRATAEVLPPGSTFKVVVAAAALEDGITPETPHPGRPQLHRARPPVRRSATPTPRSARSPRSR